VTLLANGRVVTRRRVLDRGWVSVDGSRIAGVGVADPPRVKGEVHDLAGRYVLPGFIDLHMHGGGGALDLPSNRGDFFWDSSPFRG